MRTTYSVGDDAHGVNTSARDLSIGERFLTSARARAHDARARSCGCELTSGAQKLLKCIKAKCI